MRTVLLNPRYRGVYMHGRIKKVRRGGATIRAKADPHEVLTIDVPEWRIVEDDIWFAAQERFTSRGPRAVVGHPQVKYALSGIAKCAHCGGAILSARTRVYGGGKERVKVYACSWHHQRGSTVCPVTVYQRMDDVEGALVEHISRHVLTERVLDEVLAEIAEQIEAQLPKRKADVTAVEEELRDVRAQQKRLAKAIALSDDVPELVTELRQRSTRIQQLEAQILTAKKTPAELTKLVKQIETSARTKLADMRAALANESDRRRRSSRCFPTASSSPPTARQMESVRSGGSKETSISDRSSTRVVPNGSRPGRPQMISTTMRKPPKSAPRAAVVLNE